MTERSGQRRFGSGLSHFLKYDWGGGMPIAYAMVLSGSRYLTYDLANQQTQMYLQRSGPVCGANSLSGDEH